MNEKTISANGSGVVIDGSSGSTSGIVSAKGIKTHSSLVLDGGTFSISSADDGIHSDGSIAINGGIISIASGDDGIHADSALGINGGSVNITHFCCWRLNLFYFLIF